MWTNEQDLYSVANSYKESIVDTENFEVTQTDLLLFKDEDSARNFYLGKKYAMEKFIVDAFIEGYNLAKLENDIDHGNESIEK